MSKEQIEEMAKILASDCGKCTECDHFHKEINGIDSCYFKYADMLYNAGYRKQSENVIELPCEVGDLVHFKGLKIPWKVSAIHIYEEGQPQISITSETGKVTCTMTANEFYMFCVVLTDAKMKGGEKE